MKVNDGQLDHANAEIEALRQSVRTLEGICARRLDLLKLATNCVCQMSADKCIVHMEHKVFNAIREETDEHEVGT